MRYKQLSICVSSAMLLFLHDSTQACQLCQSETGRQIRRGIWNSHFLQNASIMAAPFPVFAAIVYCLYFGFPFPRRNENPSTSTQPDQGARDR